jgi:hypothetical protein
MIVREQPISIDVTIFERPRSYPFIASITMNVQPELKFFASITTLRLTPKEGRLVQNPSFGIPVAAATRASTSAKSAAIYRADLGQSTHLNNERAKGPYGSFGTGALARTNASIKRLRFKVPLCKCMASSFCLMLMLSGSSIDFVAYRSHTLLRALRRFFARCREFPVPLTS